MHGEPDFLSWRGRHRQCKSLNWKMLQNVTNPKYKSNFFYKKLISSLINTGNVNINVTVQSTSKKVSWTFLPNVGFMSGSVKISWFRIDLEYENSTTGPRCFPFRFGLGPRDHYCTILPPDIAKMGSFPSWKLQMSVELLPWSNKMCCALDIHVARPPCLIRTGICNSLLYSMFETLIPNAKDTGG
jgi:hypothetical protein